MAVNKYIKLSASKKEMNNIGGKRKLNMNTRIITQPLPFMVG